MKRISCAVTMFALVLVPFNVAGQDKKDKKDRDAILSEAMQKKLKSAQLVLEGVVTADSKKTASSAEELIRLANSTTWPLILSPQYDAHNADFVRAAKKLVQTAKDKNMDGAALAYVEMTLSCVRCHQYVREHRRDARLDLEAFRPLAAMPVTPAGNRSENQVAVVAVQKDQLPHWLHLPAIADAMLPVRAAGGGFKHEVLPGFEQRSP